MNICTFSALDDLPKKLHGNRDAVLKILRQKGRFSCFEINTPALASMITRLFKEGAIKDIGGQYPWTEVEVMFESK